MIVTDDNTRYWHLVTDPRYQNMRATLALEQGAACTLLSQVASRGRSGHDMVVTWGWWRRGGIGWCGYIDLYLLIYWDFDCTGQCGMDRYYARFREFESNFRPARVFHSACAVTSYYAYLKQRMKTLFQISSLWATPHTLYTPTHIQCDHTNRQNSTNTNTLVLSGHFLPDTAHTFDLLSQYVTLSAWYRII